MTNDSGSKYSQASYQALFKFLREENAVRECLLLKRQKRVLTPLYVSCKAICRFHLDNWFSLTLIPTSRGNWGFTVLSPSQLPKRLSAVPRTVPRNALFGVQPLPARCRALADEQLLQSRSVLLKLTDEADLSDSEKLFSPREEARDLLCADSWIRGMRCRAGKDLVSWDTHTEQRACAPFPPEEVLDCSIVSIRAVIHRMLSWVLPWHVHGPWWLSLCPKKFKKLNSFCLLSSWLPLQSASCFISGAFRCLGGLGRCPKCLEGKERKQEWC